MLTLPELPLDPEAERHTRGLLERLLAGDRQAAEALFASQREPLRRALRPHFDRAARRRIEEEELVQRAFVRALASIERFEWRGRGAFLAWLEGIARNLLRRELAARPLERSEGDEGRSVALERIAGREPSPSQHAMGREAEARIEDALHSLAEDERELVIRRRILGQDYASLAADLGIGEAAVRTKLSRALNRMSLWLERNGGGG